MTDTAAELPGPEQLKLDSRHLRGTLAAELGDTTVDHFSSDATSVTKFHGIYQQDDRDVRRERRSKKLPLAYSCMVRASIPGGELTADQWLTFDDLTSKLSDGSLRITTRQGLQFHFIAKNDLRELVATLNEHLVTTLAACGDVARNTMACPAPHHDRDQSALWPWAQELAARVRPKTRAYYELWLDGEKAVSVTDDPAAATSGETEPLYGDRYLPRKFKIALAWPGDNCVDLFAHDLGFVPTFPEGRRDEITGFVVTAGGGMGQNHAREDDTYPRLASVIGWIPAERIGETTEAVIGIHRDFGNREDRQRARLKYILDERGVDWFTAEVDRRIDGALVTGADVPALPAWEDSDEHVGWYPQPDGRWFLGVHVDAGRVIDHENGPQIKAALRAVTERGLAPTVRMTPRQDVLLCDIDEGDRAEVDAILAEHGIIGPDDQSAVRRLAMACPALPTCGQALAEAERALPGLVDDVEAALAAAGLGDEPVRINMTGCPNGCARPYTSEVGIVGRTKRNYDVYVGGSVGGDRLNQRIGRDVPSKELPNVFASLFTRYAAERTDGEPIGDWAARVGAGALTDVVPVAAPRRRGARAAKGASGTSDDTAGDSA
ncbi:MAG: NADPH-dependent assimilatory sulfite reductase hemoprotein subunit [Actinomycetota bacterium]|nr:NADPH-dependent assimilatory sulfite reductase hemoprotein subunit [Actinomycetota bacterium]